MVDRLKKPVQRADPPERPADICDFCASPQVVKRFACRDFDSESKDAGVLYPDQSQDKVPTNLVLASHDYWAACQPCATLVEADDIDGLLERAIGVFERANGPHPLRRQLEQHIRQTYKLFFENRLEDTARIA